MNTRSNVAVLGAGAFGTALARLLCDNGHSVRLWTRNLAHVRQMRSTGENGLYLPGFGLPASLRLCTDLDESVRDCDWLLIAVPSRGFAPLLEQLVRLPIGALPPLACASKGLEPQRARLLHEVAAEQLGCEVGYAVLSGPSFAAEIAGGQPTAVTVASEDVVFARRVATALHCQVFRAYTSTDVTGVEVGGAVKNVMAIAAGICDGLGFGANTRAALVTRALAEMTRLGLALGASAATFLGLAGVGDLMLTCGDDKSRNRRFGLALGRGATVEHALTEVGALVEGLPNTHEVVRIASRVGVEMPIAEQVYKVLYQGVSPQTAVDSLLLRELRSESG
ncbi:MAG: NAD(P)-dependent glycerol-3-phosphate dehydrogenase [Gammaproteobacteria bacterium]|nr:NAD(P)-dependent glycerol-3-phosphate dehydrogenase [Gammaproteobacteria bacterium]